MFNELADVSYSIVATAFVGIALTAYISHADAMIERLAGMIETWLTKRELPLRVSWKAALAQMDAEFVANRGDEMVE